MLLNDAYRTLREYLACTQFTIDEKPIELWCGEQEGATDSAAEKSEEDLLTIIGELLSDREGLLSLNKQLKSGRSQENDLDHLVHRFITFFDSFERILYLGRSGPETEFMDNWLKAVETLYFRMKDMFEQRGLVEIKCLGKTVDLDYHEVVEMRHSVDHPTDTVIAERQKGYIYKGKVLRDAQVVVATNERS